MVAVMYPQGSVIATVQAHQPELVAEYEAACRELDAIMRELESPNLSESQFKHLLTAEAVADSKVYALGYQLDRAYLSL